jgi:NAD(P)-dependent dehydrogenase (short-subunit alcohol dehydrogenase family)
MSTPTYKFINKLQGKRVLIFGGTSGIGFAVAEGCVEHGSTVIISGSNRAKLEKTVQRLTTSYPNLNPSQIITEVCDLSNADNLDTNIKSLLFSVTEGGKKKLDHVVFTAGDALSLPSLATLQVGQLQKGGTVRNIAPAIVAKHLLEFQEKSPNSSFTMTSGVNTTLPSPGWSLLAAGGGFVEALTRGFAVDMAPIRVNVVSPGAIKTELFAGIPDQAIEQFKVKTLVKRLGRPEDVAEAYLYFMKDGFVTGAQIDSNGGRLLVG